MSRQPVAIFTTILVGLFAAGSVRAGIPAEFRKLWDDPAVTARIEQDTERYRKADAVIHVVDAQGQPIRDARVRAEQQTHEFLFGCNLFVLGQLDTPELNAKYEKAFTRIFNFATLPFYWGDLEPEQGKPRFADGSSTIWRRPPPDLLLQWCKAHDVTAKGHALLYAKNMFMPEWTVRDDPIAFMEQARKHMAELAERYGREIAVWDVINEEIPRVANLHEWHAVPDDYSLQCFREANRLFPNDVKLLINDGASQTHVTTDLCEANVKKLLDAGLRVDGIGIQFHTYGSSFVNGKVYPPEQLLSTYDRLGQLGPMLYITEITIPGTGEGGPEQQAAAVANLYRLWFSTPKMAGVTWWNLGDGTAYGNENNALGGLVDKNMDAKPAYEALDRLINHEWKTNAKGATGTGGNFTFRGFKGGYRVTVEVPGKTQTFTIDVTDKMQPCKLELDAR
uniref:1,4-beta-xylanase n=1 Tax=uncultured microorganism TaxID=358574 RepID=A0A7U1BNB4_9ZZZZ|nr:1,4-beta-xylanase [uncultured microorganism]